MPLNDSMVGHQPICNQCTRCRAWKKDPTPRKPWESDSIFCDVYPDGDGAPQKCTKPGRFVLDDGEKSKICEHFDRGPVQWSPRKKSR